MQAQGGCGVTSAATVAEQQPAPPQIAACRGQPLFCPRPQGYAIYDYCDGIPGRDADPAPIIHAYIKLNLQTLSQSGLIAGGEGGAAANGSSADSGSDGAGSTRGSPGEASASGVATAPPARRGACGPVDEVARAEVKARLKDIMGRLMQADQQAAAMAELFLLRRWGRGPGTCQAGAGSAKPWPPAPAAARMPGHPTLSPGNISPTWTATSPPPPPCFRWGAVEGGLGLAPAWHVVQAQPSSAQTSLIALPPALPHPKNFIRDGLEQLEASGGVEAARAAVVAATQGPAPPSPLSPPPAAAARPPLPGGPSPLASPSGSGLSGDGSGGGGGSAARLSALRERMGAMRTSGEGLPGAAAAAGSVAPGSARSSGAGDLSSMRSSIEELQARMASLRRISQA